MTSDLNEGNHDLHPALWLGLPLASVVICVLTPLLGYERWKPLIMGEVGFLELATVAFLVPAIVLSALIFIRQRELPRGMGAIVLLCGLAALCFAGEEASWGQHWIGYRTPDAIAKVNVQGEFNLHNIDGTGDVFNNIPRQLMLLGVIVGGIVLPLVLAKRREKLQASRSLWHWLIPTWRLVPISLLAVCSTLPEKVIKASVGPLPADSYLEMAVRKPSGELKEYAFAAAILLFLLSVYLRMGRKKKRPASY